MADPWWPLVAPRVPLPWYTPLTQHLAEWAPSRGDEVVLTLAEIRELVRGRLPKGATSPRWWTRRTYRTPGPVLREVGWEVAGIDLTSDESGDAVVSAVRFARIRDVSTGGAAITARGSAQEPDADVMPTEEVRTCTRCGGELRRVPVPCPDGRWGCIVLHLGYRCRDCGSMDA